MHIPPPAATTGGGGGTGNDNGSGNGGGSGSDKCVQGWDTHGDLCRMEARGSEHMCWPHSTHHQDTTSSKFFC